MLPTINNWIPDHCDALKYYHDDFHAIQRFKKCKNLCIVHVSITDVFDQVRHFLLLHFPYQARECNK